MSRSFAEEIAEAHHLGNFTPSCIQSRFRGFKGIHALDPNIDRLRKWANRREIKESVEDQLIGSDETACKYVYTTDILFRASQCKFETTQNEQQRYEVVKLSGPSPVTLNRPLINILDQVKLFEKKITLILRF